MPLSPRYAGQRAGHTPQYRQALRLLGGCGLCRKLAPGGHSPGPDDIQVAIRLDCTIRRHANYLGIQDSNHHRHVDHRGRVHCSVHQLKGGHPFDRTTQGGSRTWIMHRRVAA